MTTFVLVGHGDSSDTSDESAADNHHSVVGVIPPHSGGGGGHYRPAAAATGARALHWLSLADAVSATSSLLGASHEDLRLRAHQLSRALSEAFFAARATVVGPCFAGVGGGARFPEGGLFVCADVEPLARSVVDVQRALVRIVVEEASNSACNGFYDVVRGVMSQLVGDAPDGRGPAVFGREKFEAAFALEWVE
ncbi:hypothetical protein HU200_059944 [Digitaria exilis]|uniref:Uncharacterized protein n=1 Tax=Digitaria exilis TaxID=1010633 RepID=A0A835E2U1_9POAL|nr:hypothetical protein HU200_059944 [Digitaria exilis]